MDARRLPGAFAIRKVVRAARYVRDLPRMRRIRTQHRNRGAKVRVFLTGDVGRLGKLIGDELKQDYDVIGYDIRCNPRETLGNYRLLKRRMEGCSYVVHSAAIPHPNRGPFEEYFRVNVTGSLNVMRAAAANRVKRFVYLSSVGYYGCNIRGKLLPRWFPIDESHPVASASGCSEGALDAYNQSKVMAEEILAYYGTNAAFEAVSLRIAPANTKAQQYPENEPTWREDPRYRRGAFWTNCHPEYAAKAVLAAIQVTPGFTYEAFNIVDRYGPNAVDVRSFIEKEYAEVPFRGPGFEGQSLISPERAMQVLGWEPCSDR